MGLQLYTLELKIGLVQSMSELPLRYLSYGLEKTAASH